MTSPITPAHEHLSLRLNAISYLAQNTNLFEFVAPDGAELPRFTPGAHLDVHLKDGQMTRQYSLVGHPADRKRYLIAVKRQRGGRGGSDFLHDACRVGDILRIGTPRNHFCLDESARHTIFIAGGIGVTPLVPMVRGLRAAGREWEFHYAVKDRGDAAFLDDLAGPGLNMYTSADSGGVRMDVGQIVRTAPPGSHLYCCGPTGMLDAFTQATAARPELQAHLERFSAGAAPAIVGGYTVRLAASNRSIPVQPGQSILDALRGHGVQVTSSCEQGICGACETRVLAGTPDHRDSLLSEGERAANNVMMICCSGSLSAELVLDL